MRVISSGGIIRLAALTTMAAGLAGCGPSVTYGTGTSPGAQTLEDVMGIAAMGTKKKPSIDYSPRAPIVAPPPGAALPPPGSGPQSTAANWPTDPDETRRKLKAGNSKEALYSNGREKSDNVSFTMPEDYKPEYTPPVSKDSSNPQSFSAAQRKDIKKMFADARGKGGSFDAEGHPVRKYLSEPPATYREPDPNSPVEITEKPKKKTKFSLKSLWPF